MGIDDASYAINQFIKPSITVPIYYNTFDLIKQNQDEFKAAVTEREVHVLNTYNTVEFQLRYGKDNSTGSYFKNHCHTPPRYRKLRTKKLSLGTCTSVTRFHRNGRG